MSTSGNEQLDSLRARAKSAPTIPALWVDLATALESSGELDESLSAWRMVLALVPSSNPALEAIARIDSADTAETRASTEIQTDVEAPEVTGSTEPAQGKIDIDSLISSLESGLPVDETATEADEAVSAGGAIDEELEATETLARIYESQNLTLEAAKIYERLADREHDEDRAETLRAKARDLRKLAS